ncbi:MAG: OB-fold domain-containing protein [Desulfobacterales bacterium]|nr:MAG: OB-fold domain-containing protein [Desulfobacterales bacterium]
MVKEGTNRLSPVEEGLFTPPPYTESPPKLLGGYCRKCRQHYFPRPRHCRRCLDPVEGASLGSEGKLYSFTVIRTRPPLGLPQPYGVGYVDLEECGLRIFGLLDPGAVDRLRIGLPVRLAVAPLGHDARGERCLRPYFTPMEAD